MSDLAVSRAEQFLQSLREALQSDISRDEKLERLSTMTSEFSKFLKEIDTQHTDALSNHASVAEIDHIAAVFKKCAHVYVTFHDIGREFRGSHRTISKPQLTRQRDLRIPLPN